MKLSVQVAELLWAHRGVFKQERSFARMISLALGMIFAFGRRTITQGVCAIGRWETGMNAWYQLLRGYRMTERMLSGRLLEMMLQDAPPDKPFVIGVDATQIYRQSTKMPGTWWCRGRGTAAFDRGLSRAQRFVTCAWLPETVMGFTRAIPVRFLPAFSEKAVASEEPVRKEYEAALDFADWTRRKLDQAGRIKQHILLVADGAYDKAEFWRGLPERTIAIVRTAKNRVLRELPMTPLPGSPNKKRGAPRKYGAKARAPQEVLHDKTGWRHAHVPVRGRTFRCRFKVLGPYLRETVPGIPLYLIVIHGTDRVSGKTQRRLRFDPVFYLVNTIQRPNRDYDLPLPEEILLSWIWQRWELEVTHREMKSSFGVGQSQCWLPRSTVLATQWMVWLYGILTLAAFRTWGWFDGPVVSTAWYRGARRWNFNTLLRTLRFQLWQIDEFWASSPRSLATGPKILDGFIKLGVSAFHSVRA